MLAEVEEDIAARPRPHSPEAAPAEVAADTPRLEHSHKSRSGEAEESAVAIHTQAGSRQHPMPVDSPGAGAPVVTVPVTALEDSVVVQGELVVALVELCSTRSLRPGCSLFPSPVARHPVSVDRRSFRIPQEMQKSTPHVLTATRALIKRHQQGLTDAQGW